MMNIDFKNGVTSLAPLAGYTDLPFRKIAKKNGVDITFSEMISSNALIHNSAKTLKMIEKNDIEDKYIVQLAGSDLNVIKSAVEVLNDIDGILGIDLNCGCPVPKVVSQSSGSALLKDYDLLLKILETIKNTSNKKYTSAKVRIGYSEKKPQEIAEVLNKSCADFISVHGRTRSGGYSSLIDYDAIATINANTHQPVFANGDITSFEIASDVKKITNCKSLMIGRGAIGNPWIFNEIKHNKKVENISKKDVILEHLEEMLSFYGEQKAISIFRKHLHAYSKGILGAAEFRANINTITQKDLLLEQIKIFFI